VPNRTVQIVAVDWLDAQRHMDWTDQADAEALEPPLCTTVGFIVKRTRKKLVLAATIGHGDSDIGEIIVIPSGMVRSVEPLGEILVAVATPEAKTGSGT